MTSLVTARCSSSAPCSAARLADRFGGRGAAHHRRPVRDSQRSWSPSPRPRRCCTVIAVRRAASAVGVASVVAARLHRRDVARSDARPARVAPAARASSSASSSRCLVDYAITQATGCVNEPFWFGLEAWRCMFLTETVPALVLVALRCDPGVAALAHRPMGATTRRCAVLRLIDARLDPRSTIADDPRTVARRARGRAARPARPDRPDLRRSSGSASRLAVFQQFIGHQRDLLLRRRRCRRPSGFTSPATRSTINAHQRR